MSTNFDDVKAFQLKYRPHLVQHAPTLMDPDRAYDRVDHLFEELKELTRAVMSRDLEGQADALVDLVYVAMGMAVGMGLPWQALWDEVQRANMEKVAMSTKRDLHDVIKPAGWQPPNIKGVLQRAKESA